MVYFQNGRSLKSSVSFSESDFRGVDFGLGLGIGMEVNNNIQIGLGYNIGINNIGDTNDKLRNQALTITLPICLVNKINFASCRICYR